MVGLPANIFYGTGIPTCVLVFKKCRENPNNILFIDASAHFEKIKNRNILREMDITRIVETYRTRNDQNRYSHVAPMAEIAGNDYNLNILRYVDTFEAEDKVDLDAVLAELKAVDEGLVDVDARIAKFCADLGIEAPQ